MLKQRLQIDHIPALVWNDTSSKVIIAVHGNMSSELLPAIEQGASGLSIICTS